MARIYARVLAEGLLFSFPLSSIRPASFRPSPPPLSLSLSVARGSLPVGALSLPLASCGACMPSMAHADDDLAIGTVLEDPARCDALVPLFVTR